MKILIVLLPALVLLACSSMPEITQKVECEIHSYGALEPEDPSKIKKSDEVFSGYIRSYSGINIPTNSSEIELERGRRFGLEHTFSGVPEGDVLKLVLTHPEMKKTDGSIATKQVVKKNPSDGGSSYGFDRPYEQVTGEWKFEYWYDERLLCYQSFNVVEKN